MPSVLRRSCGNSIPPGGTDNFTGGTATAAAINSGGAYPYKGAHDSSLVTPPIAVTSLQDATFLKFKASFASKGHNDTLDLGISTNGGSTWANILHWTKNHGTKFGLPGENVKLNLAPYLPASGTFQLRWRNYDIIGQGWDYYAQIDDVVIGGCMPVSGGLITGQVTDAKSGEGIVGVMVTDDLGVSTRTIANPADPDLPVGTYLFFTSDGQRTLTVTKGNYTPATAKVKLPDDQIVTQDFALKGARFEATPDAFTVDVEVKDSTTASFALKNAGNGKGRFTIQGVNAPSPTSAMTTGPFALVPNYPSGADLTAMIAPDARPHPTVTAKVSSNPRAPGDVVASIPVDITMYGLGVNREAGDLWLGSPDYGPLKGDKRTIASSRTAPIPVMPSM